MTPDLPRFYAVNDRPVMLFETPDGGADVRVLDMRTGAWTIDRSYFLRVSEVGKDVDALHEAAFQQLVAQVRFGIGTRRTQQAIQWSPTGDGEFPYAATIEGARHEIRVNDFPAEPLYTVMVEGEPLIDLEDWPEPWSKPRGSV